jgi:hypothetical protein
MVVPRGSRPHQQSGIRVVRKASPAACPRLQADKVGIISALAFSTDYSGLYAAGSFSGSVSLYQEDHDGPVGHLDGIEAGGVTQVCPDSMTGPTIDPIPPFIAKSSVHRLEKIRLYTGI